MQCLKSSLNCPLFDRTLTSRHCSSGGWWWWFATTGTTPRTGDFSFGRQQPSQPHSHPNQRPKTCSQCRILPIAAATPVTIDEDHLLPLTISSAQSLTATALRDNAGWAEVTKPSSSIKDDLGIQRVSTGATFFWAIVEDIQSVTMGFNSHSTDIHF